MLEENALLVDPPKSVANGETMDVRRAAILHWPSQRPLGFAVWKKPRPNSWWPKRWTIEVFETEDASLLMIVKPPSLFFRGWEVRDAIDRRVGVVYRSTLLEESGDLLARITTDERNGAIRFTDWQQRALGTCEYSQMRRAVLHFSEELEGKPFARMILLAAMLVRHHV